MNIPTYNELKRIKKEFLIWESDENANPRTKACIRRQQETPHNLCFLLTAKYKNGRQKTLTKVVINECEFEAYISDKNKRDDVIKDACNLLDKANTGICFK
jgi:hypothetical protein